MTCAGGPSGEDAAQEKAASGKPGAAGSWVPHMQQTDQGKNMRGTIVATFQTHALPRRVFPKEEYTCGVRHLNRSKGVASTRDDGKRTKGDGLCETHLDTVLND